MKKDVGEMARCGEPGCWVELQVSERLALAYASQDRGYLALDLTVICPHRPLCGACTARFTARSPDPRCVLCSAPRGASAAKGGPT